MPAVQAIDLGTSLIKLVKEGGGVLKSSTMVVNPLGKLNLEADREVTLLAEALKKAVGQVVFEGKKVALVVSDSVVYSSVINLPVLSDTELASALKWEAEQYVPVPLKDVELSWEVLDRPSRKTGTEKMSVLLVAASKMMIQRLTDVLTSLNLEPVSIEPELLASMRAVYSDKESSALMVAALGASSISLGVSRAGKLLFVSKLNSGGVALTRAISQSLQLSLPQAEEYKRTYGVKTGVLENRLPMVMAPVLEGLVGEIRRVQSYYQQQFKGERLTRIVLTGGGALLPGLLVYLSTKTGMEISMGDPLKNLKVKETPAVSVIYTAAVGATLRS